VRIPIKATAHVPIKQAGYISATSDFHARTHLRSAAGPYIWARSGHRERRVTSGFSSGEAVSQRAEPNLNVTRQSARAGCNIRAYPKVTKRPTPTGIDEYRKVPVTKPTSLPLAISGRTSSSGEARDCPSLSLPPPLSDDAISSPAFFGEGDNHDCEIDKLGKLASFQGFQAHRCKTDGDPVRNSLFRSIRV
jgi:hypothetical protein